jgi:ABC-type multidrug transport system fused ATPase/permease subunit
MVLLFVIGLLGRASFLASSWVAGVWADVVVGSAAARSFVHPSLLSLDAAGFIGVMAALARLGFVLTVGYRVPFTRIGALSASRVYDAVTRHTSQLPQSFFDRTPVGRIVSRFSSDYGAVLRMAGGPLGEFVALIFDLALLSLALVLTDGAFAMVAVLNLAANYSVYRFNRKGLRDSRRQLSVSRGPSFAHFAETSQGHATIRLFGKEATFRSRFVELVNEYMKARIKSVTVMQRFSFMLVSVTSVLLLLTAWIGMTRVEAGDLTLGQFAVSFTYVAMMAVTTQQFFDYLGRFDEALTGVERLGEYLAQPVEVGASFSENRTNDPVADSSVHIENLRFGYGPGFSLVLGADESLNLSIGGGEKIGIIGRTGSGKSSILNALFYLYPFQTGFVAVCGHVPVHAMDSHGGDANSSLFDGLPLDTFRRQMSLIAQDPVLFRGTIADNLRVAGRQHDAIEMEAALEAVGLGDWLFGLAPQGVPRSRLGYLISEGGQNLSAGQRQLICMARALLEGAPVLIMDEATSAVDPRSEEMLMVAASRILAGKTQIRVAHRLSTLEDCDRVLWLDRGRVKMFDDAHRVLRLFKQEGMSHG